MKLVSTSCVPLLGMNPRDLHPAAQTVRKLNEALHSFWLLYGISVI